MKEELLNKVKKNFTEHKMNGLNETFINELLAYLTEPCDFHPIGDYKRLRLLIQFAFERGKQEAYLTMKHTAQHHSITIDMMEKEYYDCEFSKDGRDF